MNHAGVNSARQVCPRCQSLDKTVCIFMKKVMIRCSLRSQLESEDCCRASINFSAYVIDFDLAGKNKVDTLSSSDTYVASKAMNSSPSASAKRFSKSK